MLSGRADTSKATLRSGRRPSFQRPGSALFKATCTRTAAFASVRVATALPLNAVAGAALLKAARSSAVVLACKLARGQAAKGRSVARASSACAARVALGWARTVASSCSDSSGPASVACARQAGTAGVALGAASGAADCSTFNAAFNVIGASLATVASPVACNRPHATLSRSRRCMRPLSAPRCSCACRARRGVSPSGVKCSSATCRAFKSSAMGRRRPLGAASGCAVGSGVSCTSTRFARSSSITTCAHGAPLPRSMRRPRHARSVIATLPRFAGSVATTRCALKSPISAPFGALTWSSGRCVTSQAVPRSLPTAQPAPAAAMNATAASAESTAAGSAKARRQPRRADADADAAASAGEGASGASTAGVGGPVSGAVIRRRSPRRSARAPGARAGRKPGPPAAGRRGCASARPRRSRRQGAASSSVRRHRPRR